ncbi:hypothetical protein [Streptomyces sp. NBC_01571]|uniref:hypothetical protein n=1 Tax=Streptomyces sp. NBC_01571 TaxID=2975883 RepID=UPI002253280E|nr:hypothetical protein [Streptomyces sp. NBC_01571]
MTLVPPLRRSMSGPLEAAPEDAAVLPGPLPTRVMTARKIGQVNPQLPRQIGGTGPAGPRGVIDGLTEGKGAAQSDHHVLDTPPRADHRFFVVLLVPGIHDLPTEPASQVVP